MPMMVKKPRFAMEFDGVYFIGTLKQQKYVEKYA